MFVDSHIHLSHHLYDGEVPCIDTLQAGQRILYINRDALIDKLKADGIECCVEPGIGLESNHEILKLSEAYPDFLYPAVGVHPTRAPWTKWKSQKELEALSNDKSVVAIGELGLDYHYERRKQHRIRQKRWFVWQLHLAHRRQLPLILHIRLADRDAIKILRHFKKKVHGGVVHCFNRGVDIAKVYTEEFGFMLGIGGSLLQENCAELECAVRDVPLEYLLLETDGPYVKPAKPEELSAKQWGKARNTSLIIPDIAARVAEIKDLDVAEVERITRENAKRLFGIKYSIDRIHDKMKAEL